MNISSNNVVRQKCRRVVIVKLLVVTTPCVHGLGCVRCNDIVTHCDIVHRTVSASVKVLQ